MWSGSSNLLELDSALRRELLRQRTRLKSLSSSSDSGNVDGAPKGFHKLKKSTRKDSIIDFQETNPSMQEANARLQQLEDSVQKIEALLVQLVNGDAADDGDGAPVGDDEEDKDAPPGAHPTTLSP